MRVYYQQPRSRTSRWLVKYSKESYRASKTLIINTHRVGVFDMNSTETASCNVIVIITFTQ